MSFNSIGGFCAASLSQKNKIVSVKVPINLWERNNKLTIHAVKSEAIIKTQQIFFGPLKPVMPGDKVLNFVTETKCLGVITDN